MSGGRRVVIIGGGFTGAATAIHLTRAAASPLDVTVIEPRDEVGRGLAYSARDPDHRINAPTGIHLLYPDDPDGFETWLRRTGRLDQDPEIEAFDGSLFPRRAALGAYVNHEFQAHVAENPSGSRLAHCQDRALCLERADGAWRAVLESGDHLDANLVVIATSNERPALPPPFDAGLAAHPAFIADPWDLSALDAVGPNARVLILGAGLTAADVMATLLRDKPAATLEAISRSGLRPTSRPRSHAGMPQPIWERLNAMPSLFEQAHGAPQSVRGILAAVRTDIAHLGDQGLPWQGAFDELRDSARRVWMGLPAEEQRRFQRHVRRLYDSCRFRYPPQTEEIVRAAEEAGRVIFHVGRVTSAIARDGQIEVSWTGGDGTHETHAFDHVVNCVGPASRPDRSANPLLKALVADGVVRVAPLGIGLDVDEDCRAVGRDGTAEPGLYVLGPLTFARFFYPLGVPFILDQVIRALPRMLAGLDRPAA